MLHIRIEVPFFKINKHHKMIHYKHSVTVIIFVLNSLCENGRLECTMEEDCDIAYCGYDEGNEGTTKLVKVTF